MDNIFCGSTFFVECLCCEKQTKISGMESRSVSGKVGYKCEDKLLFLTYVNCEHCGEKMYVQIDNNDTIGLLYSVSHIVGKIAKAKLKNQSVSHKDSSKYNKLTNRLNASREKLMSKYEGKTFVCQEPPYYEVIDAIKFVRT